MKITKSQLKQIIKEEIQEAMYGAGEHAGRKIGMQDVGRQRYDSKTEAPPDIARTWIRAIEKEIAKQQKRVEGGGFYLFDKRSVLTDFEHSMRGWNKTYWADRAKASRRGNGEALFTDAGEMPDKRSANAMQQMDSDGWPRIPEGAPAVPQSDYDHYKKFTAWYKFLPPSEDLEGREAGAAPEGEYDLSAFGENLERIIKEELEKALKE